MRSVCLCGLLILSGFGSGEASAQDTAAEEALHRAMVMAQLPPDAAKGLFGRESTPAAGPPQAIGSYERGCLSGAIALPADGPNWQVMRPSRNRAWGHPVLIAFLERLAQKLPGEAGWPGLLVGDIQIGGSARPSGTPFSQQTLSRGMGEMSTQQPGHRSIVFCWRRSPESPWWSAFLSTRLLSARCAARAGRGGPG